MVYVAILCKQNSKAKNPQKTKSTKTKEAPNNVKVTHNSMNHTLSLDYIISDISDDNGLERLMILEVRKIMCIWTKSAKFKSDTKVSDAQSFLLNAALFTNVRNK